MADHFPELPLRSVERCLKMKIACIASVPVQSNQNLGRAKNGARAKRWKVGGGEFEEHCYTRSRDIIYSVFSTF